MKIYTKVGDKGMTTLAGGQPVRKDNERIEAYGTIDELNSYIGLIRSFKNISDFENFMIKIQENLMICSSILAYNSEDTHLNVPSLHNKEIDRLEKEIDLMENELPLLKSFIIPGGNEIIAFCHIARTICRRAERNVVHLTKSTKIQENILKYLNRLSDYLFVLSRHLAKRFNINERKWQSKVE